MESYLLEKTYNGAAIRRELFESMQYEMMCRDKTDKSVRNEATGVCVKKLSGQKRTREGKLLGRDDVFLNVEEEMAVSKAAESPDFSKKKETKKGIVTRHAVALKITDKGDVIVLDPATSVCRVLSRLDVVTSCHEFCKLVADYWAVYELSVTFTDCK